MTRLRGYETALPRVASIEGALVSTGQAARRYYTPEEMSAFAAYLEKRGPDLLPVAEQAGLGDLDARWRYELLTTRPNALSSRPHEQRLIDLETRRMQFPELAGYLEDYWKMKPVPERYYVLDEAAEAWCWAGDSRNELRVLESDPQVVQRYVVLAASLDPARLVTLAGKGSSIAVDQAIATGQPALAYQAIAAFGLKQPPVWTKAYTALAGLYDLDREPRVDAAFRSALDVATIGQRLAQPANRDRELTGDVWFYYGSRYGEYLAGTHQGRPEDYLPASLETAPGNPAAYAGLADSYADRGDAARALADYDRALELSPDLGYIHDHAALVLWKEGRRADADDPGGQPIQPVDEVDRVDGHHDDQDGEHGLLVGRERERPPARDGQPGHHGAAPDQDRPGAHLAGQLGDGAQSPAVVHETHENHEATGQQQAAAYPGAHEHGAQVGQPGGHQQGRGEAEVHRDAAQQRDGLGVDVPRPAPVLRTHRDREPAYQRREQISDGGGHQDCEAVLAHSGSPGPFGCLIH